MTTADLAPLRSKQPSRHRRAGKGELQMQTVETPHDRKVGFRHRAWQIVDAATADVQSFRLLGDGQVVRGLDHRFALSKPALPSAPSKKSFSSVSSPILACSDFTSMAGCAAPLAASATFALKVAVWFRRCRLFMVSPDSLGTACPLSGRNSTYRSVQISETSSLRRRKPESLVGPSWRLRR